MISEGLVVPNSELVQDKFADIFAHRLVFENYVQHHSGLNWSLFFHFGSITHWVYLHMTDVDSYRGNLLKAPNLKNTCSYWHLMRPPFTTQHITQSKCSLAQAPLNTIQSAYHFATTWKHRAPPTVHVPFMLILNECIAPGFPTFAVVYHVNLKGKFISSQWHISPEPSLRWSIGRPRGEQLQSPWILQYYSVPRVHDFALVVSLEWTVCCGPHLLDRSIKFHFSPKFWFRCIKVLSWKKGNELFR